MEHRIQQLEAQVRELTQRLKNLENASQGQPEKKEDAVLRALSEFKIDIPTEEPTQPSVTTPASSLPPPFFPAMNLELPPVKKDMDLPSLHLDIPDPEPEVPTSAPEDNKVVETHIWTGTAGIESMKHIVGKLEVLWGYPECNQFLAQLIVMEQPTPERPMRQGFHPKVMSEILFLQRLMGHICPAPEVGNGWELTHKRG